MNSGNTTPDVLEIGEFIGAGMYGVVFMGRYNTRKAAIKKFRLHQHTTDEAVTIEQEIGLLKHLRYRYIIQYYGVHRYGNEISLIMDFAEGGSLKQAIEDSRVTGWHVKNRIAQEIAHGLAYIHHEGILHRDLKSDNVLLTGLMEAKLCDFGLAVVKTSSGGHSTEVVRGTVRWLAPELVLSERPRYTTKSDMYALGMVLWEMAAMCTLPFRTMSNNYVVAQAVESGRREQLPDETPVIYQHWVHLCWMQGPSDRPDAHTVIIVDDASSRRRGAITPDVSSPASTNYSQDQGIASEVSSPASWVSEESRAAQPLMEFVSLSRMAALNDVDAQVSLAEMYDTGNRGVPKDNEMAFVWYLRAAQQGHLDAMDRVGDMYAQGREHDPVDESWFRTTSRKQPAAMESSRGIVTNVLDTSQDRVEARAEIQAAERGDSSAQFNIGWMYETGHGVEQSDVDAFRWYTEAASQGNPIAENNLGWMYETGRGVEQSDVEAVKWYTKAARQGNPNAQYNLGWMNETGRGVEQRDIEAVWWYTKAASQGSPMAQNNLGLMYMNGRGVQQSDIEAVKWFSKAAIQGSPTGQNNLGLMYRNGRGVEQSDVEAVKWYTKAVSQGNPMAQCNLGLMYMNGLGVKQSDVEAVRWFSKAARQGNPMAENNLGVMYRSGRGVEQSDVEALMWYSMAASGGNPLAQSNLGWMYDLGQVVKQDDKIAVEWYKRSSAQDNVYGHGNLASMYELGFGVQASDDHALDLFTRANDKGYPGAHFHVKWLTSPDRWTPCSDSDAVEVNRIGAEKGYVAAQHNLGRLYERGRGAYMDKGQALAWYRMAAAQGHTDSQRRMEFLQRQ
ncbi:hypothetical protein DFQ27_004988 [Actinomortierella ambigua]|uniref:Protein kinase domain-containing protein n=1 Tax=Actinomortierella ambigua TaxID=1343610 RepID=A0A9P6UC81_9FUNG|nr:hypothetical protein DFQ27_004988 [Actinomortierella ambigua]